MTGTPIIIIGAGGHAKVCIEALRAQGQFEPIACVDPKTIGSAMLGVPVVGGDEHLPILRGQGLAHAFVAIGSNKVRAKMAEHAVQLGFALPRAIDPFSRVSPTARLGDGVLVMPGAIINAEAQIGDLAIVNSGAIIEHDCVVGTAAHLAPGSVLAGAVRVGARTFLGAGVKVRDGKSVCADVVVGSGGVVVADITEPGVYVGVPARRLEGRAS